MELDLEALTNGFKKKTKNKNQKNKKETFTEIYCNITVLIRFGLNTILYARKCWKKVAWISKGT